MLFHRSSSGVLGGVYGSESGTPMIDGRAVARVLVLGGVRRGFEERGCSGGCLVGLCKLVEVTCSNWEES